MKTLFRKLPEYYSHVDPTPRDFSAVFSRATERSAAAPPRRAVRVRVSRQLTPSLAPRVLRKNRHLFTATLLPLHVNQRTDRPTSLPASERNGSGKQRGIQGALLPKLIRLTRSLARPRSHCAECMDEPMEQASDEGATPIITMMMMMTAAAAQRKARTNENPSFDQVNCDL